MGLLNKACPHSNDLFIIDVGIRQKQELREPEEYRQVWVFRNDQLIGGEEMQGEKNGPLSLAR